MKRTLATYKHDPLAVTFSKPKGVGPYRWIKSVQVHLTTRDEKGELKRLVIDPLRDPEIMAVLTVKYLEQIADHWPASEPLDKERKRELNDAASLISALLLQL